jgi:hypothetical protein
MRQVCILAIGCLMAVTAFGQRRGGGGFGGGHAGGRTGGFGGVRGGTGGVYRGGTGYRGASGYRGGYGYRGTDYGRRGYYGYGRYSGYYGFYPWYSFYSPWYWDAFLSPDYYDYYPNYNYSAGGYYTPDYSYTGTYSYEPSPGVMIINSAPAYYPPPQYAQAPPPPPPQPPPAAPQAEAAPYEPTVYSIALKDHTIVSAIAYWVLGGALHYVTRDHAMKEIALSRVDRRYSEQINRDNNVDFRLPAEPQRQARPARK